jgi:hypothetical protein
LFGQEFEEKGTQRKIRRHESQPAVEQFVGMYFGRHGVQVGNETLFDFGPRLRGAGHRFQHRQPANFAGFLQDNAGGFHDGGATGRGSHCRRRFGRGRRLGFFLLNHTGRRFGSGRASLLPQAGDVPQNDHQ